MLNKFSEKVKKAWEQYPEVDIQIEYVPKSKEKKYFLKSCPHNGLYIAVIKRYSDYRILIQKDGFYTESFPERNPDELTLEEMKCFDLDILPDNNHYCEKCGSFSTLLRDLSDKSSRNQEKKYCINCYRELRKEGEESEK